MRILMIGDVIRKPGRDAVRALLPDLKREKAIDFVTCNGENAAGGCGITADTAAELLQSAVDVLTSGNHIRDKKEMIPLMAEDLPLIRPANYPDAPGRGYIHMGGVTVVNLMGRVFMASLDCPFRTAEALLDQLKEVGNGNVIIVDFHAEATSEKQAMGRYLDGRVGGVLDTHTHVGTVDAKMMPQGTAYLTDVGMTGPRDFVIGSDNDAMLERFLTSLPSRLTAASGPCALNAALVEVDEETGNATSIERIDRTVN